MKGLKAKKAFAGFLSAAMLGMSLPASAVVNAVEATTEIIYSSGFEDGDVSAFSGRGGVETITATTEQAYSGEYSMKVSDREKSWHAPWIRIDEICEPNTEYMVSAAVKTEWYNNVIVSWEYTDTAGERHFFNLKNGTSNGDWVVFEDLKVSFTEEMTNVYIYIECGDTATMYVDDFTLETAPIYPIQDELPSISDVYSPYFDIGTAIMASNLASPSFMDLVEKHFDDSITFGNELKPDSVLDEAACLAYFEENGDDTNPQVTLSAARSLLNYCRDTNTPVRGHTLVWHSQTPDWFFREGYDINNDWVSKEKMLLRMENYIKNVFAALEAEYPDVNIYAWDVVNEAWLDNGTPRTGGTQTENPNYSGWVKVFGDNSFIEPAFEYARKYAPEGTKLYYNDFNEYMPEKTTAIVEMATSLKEKGLIDGIGCQSHLDSRSGSDAFPAVSVYEKAIAAFAATGLDIQITEIDATTDRDEPTDENFEGQAQYYSDIMDVLIKYSDSISTVVFWGVTDDQSWRAWGYPLLFDAQCQAKPAYYSIVDGLEVPDISEPETTEPPTETTTAVGGDPVEFTDVIVEITDEAITFENSGTFNFLYGIDDKFGGYAAGDTVSVGIWYTETENGNIINYVSYVEKVEDTSSCGDANEDGTVDINDAVLIMSHMANKSKYPIEGTAADNADVYQRGDGISIGDANAIQKYLAKLIKTLPES